MIGRRALRMSPEQRLAVRQIDSAPLLSDLRNRGSCHRGGGPLGGRACRLWLCHRPEWLFAPELKSGAVISGPCRLRYVGGVPNGPAGKCEGSRLYDGHGTAPFERSWATDERAAPITARSRSAIGATSSSGRVPVKDRNPPTAAVRFSRPRQRSMPRSCSFRIAFREFKSLADIRPLLRLFRKLPLHEAHEGARFGARLSPGRKHRPKFGRRQ